MNIEKKIHWYQEILVQLLPFTHEKFSADVNEHKYYKVKIYNKKLNEQMIIK